MAYLLIQTGTDERKHELEFTETSIGRGPANTVNIDDSKLSRNHIMITMNDDGYQVQDLESHNGTYVNQKRIKKQMLNSGDIINMGFTRIVFSDSSIVSSLDDDTQYLVDAEESQIFHKKQSGDESFAITHLTIENKILLKMQEINKALNKTHDLNLLLTKIVDSAIQLMGATHGLLIRSEEQNLSFLVARGSNKKNLVKKDISVSKNIVSEVFERGVSLLADDAKHDSRFKGYLSVVDMELASVMCVPLSIHDKKFGVLYLQNKGQKGVFNKQQLRHLRAFADQASIVMYNTNLLDQLTQKQTELQHEKTQVEKLNNLLEEKVHRTEKELGSIKKDYEQSKQDLKLKYSYDQLIGKSASMQKLYLMLDKVTDSRFPVLIQGESGTGKELVAKAIHYNGATKDARFIAENVSAISPTLLESELFGHVKGAFTGATHDKKGLFELADGGTLFLDEIGEMSLDMQKKMLRVLQEGEIRRVGGKDVIPVNVRIISATHRNLTTMIEENNFRNDLYYRLNVFNILIAPLRERKEDIPLLLDHFLSSIATEQGAAKKTISNDVMVYLMNYSWPGNIREIRNEVEKLVALSDDKINVELLSPHILDVGLTQSSDADHDQNLIGYTLREIEQACIEQTLAHLNGKKVDAASMLGIPRKTLYNKIKHYGLNY